MSSPREWPIGPVTQAVPRDPSVPVVILAAPSGAAEALPSSFAGSSASATPEPPADVLTNAVSRSSVASIDDRFAGLEIPESWVPGGSQPEGDPYEERVMAAERMRVYQVALELQCCANTLVPSIHRVIRDQFERASLSVVLNSAEAFGRYSRKQKRYHVAVARGSAMECAAICDVLRMRRLAPTTECARAKRFAVRCVAMLSKLEQALSKPSKDEAVEASA